MVVVLFDGSGSHERSAYAGHGISSNQGLAHGSTGWTCRSLQTTLEPSTLGIHGHWWNHLHVRFLGTPEEVNVFERHNWNVLILCCHTWGWKRNQVWVVDRKKCLIEIVSCYSSIHYSIFKPAARVFLVMECYGFAYLSLDRASLHFPMFPMVQLLRALYIRKRGGLRWPNSSAPCCSCRAWRRRSAQGDAWTFLGF